LIDEQRLDYLGQITDDGHILKNLPLETQAVDDDCFSDAELCLAATTKLNAELDAAISEHIRA
jgi:hypothetical protein